MICGSLPAADNSKSTEGHLPFTSLSDCIPFSTIHLCERVVKVVIAAAAFILFYHRDEIEMSAPYLRCYQIAINNNHGLVGV
jgi:hypothetical protein